MKIKTGSIEIFPCSKKENGYNIFVWKGIFGFICFGYRVFKKHIPENELMVSIEIAMIDLKRWTN
jgi:hypothetical protein